MTYEQQKQLAHLLARIISDELPKIATINRSVKKRDGKVYVDFIQNGHGRVLVSPFCVRPVPGALVSTPFKWSEVNKKLDHTRFTIKSVPARMKRLKSDPLADVLELKPDLTAALEKLASRLG